MSLLRRSEEGDEAQISKIIVVDQREGKSQGQEPEALEENLEERQHHQASPFLRLPQELRNKIYLLAFKPENYFIDWETEYGLLTHAKLPCHHTPLYANLGTKRDYEASIRRGTGTFYSLRSSHSPLDLESPPTDVVPPGPASLLLSCRQINLEATPVFYGGSAFHFASRSVLRKFLYIISNTSKKSIRTLCIGFAETKVVSGTAAYPAWYTEDEADWARLFMQAANDLTGLEKLSLRIDFSYRFYRYPTTSPSFEMDMWISTWGPFVPGRGPCALKQVEIVSNSDGGVGGKLTIEALKRLLLGEEQVGDIWWSLPVQDLCWCHRLRACPHYRSVAPCVGVNCPLKYMTDGYVVV